MSANPAERHRVARAFGAVIKIRREERKLSQERLSESADVDRTYPSLLERGLRTPTLTVIFELARALDVDPAQLVSDTMDRLRREDQP